MLSDIGNINVIDEPICVNRNVYWLCTAFCVLHLPRRKYRYNLLCFKMVQILTNHTIKSELNS